MNAWQTWIALWTLVTKEVRRYMRIWPQTLLPPSITMTMYFIIFGNLIGSRIGPMDDIPYIDYIVPGLIMMAVITNSYSNVASSFFSNKFQRSVEEMMVSPMPNWVILAGFVIGGASRGLAVGLIVTVVSMFFTDLSIHHPWVTIGVVIMTALLFSIGGFINALVAHKFDDISIVPIFVLTPLTYLGGVFYSINMLPDFWQGVSMVNPILYMVNAFRYGILGVSDIPVGGALVAIAIFIVVFFAVGLWMLDRGKGIRS
ncbi:MULTISPECIES: ABC transporter permease [Chromohalobacter]|uniref:Transport permease protein n=1 Tax=Chromohalobacter israelensis (strain ATCC BAA-138 / DSM 3043 / CIP 106854 / NCIMB 13768 / 1H11) TaxID=290398 RepID=Q1QXV1_CHRI1|nr:MULTISPECIES: ABC transporter permease [Chromohalobacter]ABE58707.1 ABC-2 protein [Chromohalobacter salexigens DSM 3043]MBZ5875247.1 ABC transporter permease [Chromohalobacter salexigens]MDF9434978.1 ABC transporter permease [Chromohalobacter israelensis]NQY44644.1 ABC transporter permease [Chromohalobacter sp.]NWO54829.1 ABC transporter permease [Chromohalobacter salexigens]